MSTTRYPSLPADAYAYSPEGVMACVDAILATMTGAACRQALASALRMMVEDGQGGGSEAVAVASLLASDGIPTSVGTPLAAVADSLLNLVSYHHQGAPPAAAYRLASAAARGERGVYLSSVDLDAVIGRTHTVAAIGATIAADYPATEGGAA